MGVEMVASSIPPMAFEIAPTLKMQQFCHLYFVRLSKIKPWLDIHKWNTPCDDILTSISDMVNVGARECVVSGLIVKKFAKRPNIFESQLSLLAEKSLVLKPSEGNRAYVGELDEILLEDETSWVKVSGLPAAMVTTGMVVAARGILDAHNTFQVSDYTFCREEPKAPPVSDGQKSIGFISGSIGTLKDLKGAVSFFFKQNLAKVVVCGNMVQRDMDTMKDVDTALNALSTKISVDLMPGDEDPSTGMLPYAPISKLFFERSSKQAAFTLRTNPCAFTQDDTMFIGSSGENVTDLLRNTSIDSSVEALNLLLATRHLAPTAPDTLHMVPHTSEDLMVMSQVPHVLFAGNQESFAFKCVRGVTLLSVPAFKRQPGVTIVSINDPTKVHFVPMQ